LLFFALLDFVWALSLVKPAVPLSSTNAFLSTIAPLHVWAGAWLVVGVICLAGALGRRRWSLLDVWPFLFALMIKVFWATAIMLGWMLGEIARGWVASGVWIAFALLVVTIAGWAEPVDER
jgi:hypothetical protein